MSGKPTIYTQKHANFPHHFIIAGVENTENTNLDNRYEENEIQVQQENIQPNLKQSRRLGESTFEYLQRQTKQQMEKFLGSQITDVPEKYLVKFAKDKTIQALKQQLEQEPKPKQVSFQDQKVNATVDKKPKIRAAYSSFSPQRESRRGSMHRMSSPLIEPSVNVSRVQVSYNASPFDSHGLRLAFK